MGVCKHKPIGGNNKPRPTADFHLLQTIFIKLRDNIFLSSVGHLVKPFYFRHVLGYDNVHYCGAHFFGDRDNGGFFHKQDDTNILMLLMIQMTTNKRKNTTPPIVISYECCRNEQTCCSMSILQYTQVACLGKLEPVI